MTASTTAAGPAEFRRAVARLDVARLRTEVEIGPLPAPARLAPWSHALSATLYPAGSDEETASGRMILLFDPDGVDAWGGSLRIVVFATCELDTEIAQDPLLPEVAWSWLTESLDGSRRRIQRPRRHGHGHLVDPIRRHRRTATGGRPRDARLLDRGRAKPTCTCRRSPGFLRSRPAFRQKASRCCKGLIPSAHDESATVRIGLVVSGA